MLKRVQYLERLTESTTTSHSNFVKKYCKFIQNVNSKMDRNHGGAPTLIMHPESHRKIVDHCEHILMLLKTTNLDTVDTDWYDLLEFKNCFMKLKYGNGILFHLSSNLKTQRKRLIANHPFRAEFRRLRSNESNSEVCSLHNLTFNSHSTFYRHVINDHPEACIETSSLPLLDMPVYKSVEIKTEVKEEEDISN